MIEIQILKSFFFPFFDSIMYYFTCTLFSVSATITGIANTIRCTTKKVHIIWTTISHFDFFWPSTAVTSKVKTHLPLDLTICYCGVSTFQPAGSICATSVFPWTWSWHSCAGGPLKTKPVRSDSPVTMTGTSWVRNPFVITVKASVILTFWYMKKNNYLTFKKLENHWIFWYFL